MGIKITSAFTSADMVKKGLNIMHGNQTSEFKATTAFDLLNVGKINAEHQSLLEPIAKTYIYSNIKLLLDSKESYEEMSVAKNPYGDGFSSRYIADAIQQYFN